MYDRNPKICPFSTPEEWIILMNLGQKSILGQNITSGSTLYKCMERMLKGDTKAEFLQKANLVGSTVANIILLIATTTVHAFPAYMHLDQRQYLKTYLRKPPEMKVWILSVN